MWEDIRAGAAFEDGDGVIQHFAHTAEPVLPRPFSVVGGIFASVDGVEVTLLRVSGEAFSNIPLFPAL
jgi:hypothetical protein